MDEKNTNLTPSENEIKGSVKRDAKGLFDSISMFLSELLSIKSETDRDQTIEDVKKDIPFEGHNAWILVFSIFVASIGLNVSSTAVVIGAMLISPLMGPIVGVGLSIAINDIDTLKRSLINLGVMVGLSVMTATFYFLVSPLTELTPELEARTAPTILDVLVAIFGGLALIVAKSKRGTMPNAIAGVAIATALMPPLCTVGYGLAEWQLDYAIGALYLFSINAIFIALATFTMSKVLGFPMIRYANSASRKRTARLASAIAIVVMIPAMWTFYTTLNESNAQRDYRQFLEEDINSNENLYLRKDFYNYNEKTIKLYFDGEIAESAVSDLKNEIKKYDHIGDFVLTINGNKARGIDQISKILERTIGQLNRLEEENKTLLSRIETLNAKNAELQGVLDESAKKALTVEVFPYQSIAKDAKIRFPELLTLGYADLLQSNFLRLDTLKTIFPVWKANLNDSLINDRKKRLHRWLINEMKVDTLFIK